MRVWPIVLTLLGGCVTPSDSTYGGGWGSGYGGGGGTGGYGCEMDSQCPTGNVCARDGECLAPSQVKIIHVTWTVSGQPASMTTCQSAPDLDLTFSAGQNDYFGFSPVPCAEGKFTIDKLPTWYTRVDLARAGSSGAGGVWSSFDAMGNAALDLPY